MRNITAVLTKLPEGPFCCKDVHAAPRTLMGLIDEGYLQRTGCKTIHFWGSDLRRLSGKARKTYRASIYQLTPIGLDRRAKGLR